MEKNRTLKKYECHGIKTEADRLLISNATNEIYTLAVSGDFRAALCRA